MISDKDEVTEDKGTYMNEINILFYYPDTTFSHKRPKSELLLSIGIILLIMGIIGFNYYVKDICSIISILLIGIGIILIVTSAILYLRKK